MTEILLLDSCVEIATEDPDLVMRRLGESDAPELHESALPDLDHIARGDERLAKILGSLESTRQWIMGQPPTCFLPGAVFGIYARTRFVGTMSYRDDAKLFAHVGYWVREADTGHGYASGVLHPFAIRLHAVGYLVVKAQTRLDNEASRRTAVKAGFKCCGQIGNLLDYQFTG